MKKNIASTENKNANGANNWLKFTNSSPPPVINLSKLTIQVNLTFEYFIVLFENP